MISIENMSHVMKEYYLDVVAEQINKTTSPFYAKMEQTQDDVWGKEVVKAIACGINGGIGAGTETGALPTASANNYVVARLPLKNLYGKIEISDKAIRASSNKDGSFVNLLNAEMEGLLSAAKFNMARMLFGHSNGILAYIISTENADGYKQFRLSSTRSFVEGMKVDCYDSSGNVVYAGALVIGVDRANNKIKLAGATGSAPMEGGTITVQGSSNNELTGLGQIFDPNLSTLYGVDVASHPWFKPYLEEQKTFSVELMQKTIDHLEMSSGSTPDMIICSADVRRMYLDELYATRRNVDYMNLDGGFKSLCYNGTPVVVERFAEEGSMFFLNTADFKLHQLCDWRWLEGDDGKILKQIPGTPVYSATLVKYADMLCARPNAQAELRSLKAAN